MRVAGDGDRTASGCAVQASEESTRTLEDLGKAIVAKVHEHQRVCRCGKCFREGYANCLDCPECRVVVEDDVLDILRTVNRKG